MSSNPLPLPAPVKLDGAPAKKSGRPPKLTRELIKKVADVVAAGNYLDTAAVYCGVSRASFHDWMARAHKQKRGIYRDFLDALHQAQAIADVRDHANITKAGARDWKASAEHLRLRNQSRYNRKTVEHAGEDGKAINVNVSGSVEASLLDVFKRLASVEDPDDEPTPAAVDVKP